MDATASTPLPVDAKGVPLADGKRFAKNINALAWLWKDHTSFAEAAQITEAAAKQHPEYLAKCGGTYSSEWFWSKALHCIRVAPEVMEAAAAWVEQSDFIPAVLTGNNEPDRPGSATSAPPATRPCTTRAGRCRPRSSSTRIDPATRRRAAAARRSTRPTPANERAGELCRRSGRKSSGLHGRHARGGRCDRRPPRRGRRGRQAGLAGQDPRHQLVRHDDPPEHQPLPDIPGLCGIVDGSIVPGYFGLEAGQSAVGDIFNWFVNHFDSGEKAHAKLVRARRRKLKPGESGLLALDWNNGNRTVLVDPRLTGLLVGQTLHTTRAEVYRALIEGSAIGARVIMERFEEYGVKVDEVINCGGIAEKNPLVMQIYADVTGRPMKVSRSGQTCALGCVPSSARSSRARPPAATTRVEAAQAKMCGLKPKVYKPDAKRHAVYNELFKLYRQLHDAFGTTGYAASLHNVMKDLLAIRDRARGIA